MIRSLIGILLAGLVVGCAIEEQQSSGALTVDPNSDTVVPEGLTARDVDLNNDGTVNILDLVIVSKLFGDVEAEEAVVAESCPAGFFRELVPKVVGYDSQVSAQDVPVDSSGRRLEDKHKESCDYLYPNWRGNGKKTPIGCLIHCAYLYSTSRDRSYLCHQKEKSYSECKRCSRHISPFRPIKVVEYSDSPDPTECLGKDIKVKYLFPNPNGGHYAYGLFKMATFVPENGDYNTSAFIRIHVNVAIRVAVNGRTPPTELKIKIEQPDKYIVNGGVNEITYDITRWNHIDKDNHYELDIPETKYKDGIKYTSWSNSLHNYKLPYDAFSIGNPTTVTYANRKTPENVYTSDNYIVHIQFPERMGSAFIWGPEHGSRHKMFPEEVRAKYFPEDIK